MDILLHIAGLAFIPIMLYILVSGLQDIVIMLRRYGPQIWAYDSKKTIPEKYFRHSPPRASNTLIS